MTYILASNTAGKQIKVYPENAKGMSKSAFVKKMSKHLAFSENVFDQIQTALQANEKVPSINDVAKSKANKVESTEKVGE